MLLTVLPVSCPLLQVTCSASGAASYHRDRRLTWHCGQVKSLITPSFVNIALFSKVAIPSVALKILEIKRKPFPPLRLAMVVGAF
jgi:hypothetical protein